MRLVLALLCGGLLAPAVWAQSLQNTGLADSWEMVPGLSSAGLAAQGWEQTSSSGLSWPDGSQAVVSFWQLEADDLRLTLRCVSLFDLHLQPTGDQCYQPREAL